MSNVNIRRAVSNIRSGTNVYTPVVEIVVNAIQAIEADETKGPENGLIEIIVNRSNQSEAPDSISEVNGFTVSDNGIGFTANNRDSFDTLYSTQKISEGGKGFGRFTCLKYFEDLVINSIYREQGKYMSRDFKMGKDTDIIVDEDINEVDCDHTGTTVRLVGIKKIKIPDKKLITIARVLVELLLPYFVNEDTKPPIIKLQESDGSEEILLNDFVDVQGEMKISEIKSALSEFSIKGVDLEQFTARVFKFYSPRSPTSKISLVANRREVTSVSIHRYIPEFIDEFYEKKSSGEDIKDRNFIIKVYVFGNYLDDNVSLERGGFDFHAESELMLGISRREIEEKAAQSARQALNTDVEARKEKKALRVADYVNQKAPWHVGVLKNMDLSSLPYNATEAEIENELQRKKYQQEIKVRGEVKKLLESGTLDDLREKASEIALTITDSSRNDLTHYVALRRSVIDLFEKSLQADEDGKHNSEGLVHDIIFPRRGDTDTTPFDDHNLWLVDERLNFTEFLSSDQPLSNKGERPDLLAYDKRVVFRGENEPSNPVTIFEFKKPQRDDFVNPSSQEDPVQQIIRYVRKIRSGDFKTPKGREIQIADNTPYYGYVVCDLTRKVKVWVEEEKNFTQMPDRLGYFHWHDNLNLYMEVISWDKVLKDSIMRNRIFFQKLGIFEP